MRRSLSPLRYPGGKGKLSASIAKVIGDNKLTGGHYAEPYAGGAAVGLFLLFNEYVSNFHLNDLDPAIYAFWYSVLNESEWLCERIRGISVTPEEWRRQREIHAAKFKAHDIRELGFATFFLNRTNRSGIIKGGGMIGGNDQSGKWKLDVRFNRRDLVERILEVSRLAPRIKLTNLDAESFLTDVVGGLPQKSLIYLDPPYFEKGPGLYESHYKIQDHIRLAKHVTGKLKHKWLVSYDAHPAILEMYSERRSLLYDLRYQAADKRLGKEVMVFSDNLFLSVHPSQIFPVPF